MMQTSSRNKLIIVRDPESIYKAEGEIENGNFHGRWHFSFGDYYDRDYTHFGTLRVFNDDTLSPGAVWPLHPHRNIEIVTYCAAGEFRHADQTGEGNILRKGWVQHTTVGKGLWHSEINNRPDEPMRFIQIWFLPTTPDLEPALQQKRVERAERTNRLFPLVSNRRPEALPIASEATIYSSFLEAGKKLDCICEIGHGGYIYVLEGGPVDIEGHVLEPLGAAKIIGHMDVEISALADAEMLLVSVPLSVGNIMHHNAGL